MKPLIYLDNAATTFPKPDEVYEALDYANRNYSFNAGRGSYLESSKCSDIILECKKELAKVVNRKAESVTFLSSATQSLNNLLYGLKVADGDSIYISPFEHNSVVRPVHFLSKIKNCNLHLLPFNKTNWLPDLSLISDMFAMNNPRLVVLTRINNVTGYVLPYEEIFRIAKEYECVTILDCAQSYGIYPDEFKYTDYVVFAGHKSLYATFGVAGFVNLTENKDVIPIFRGGTGSDSLNVEMPGVSGDKYEAGSPNIVAIYGLYKSLQWLQKNDLYSKELLLTDYLINKLKNLKKVHLYTPESPQKIFGILSLNVDGYECEDVGTILYDEFNICVRTGYHCCPYIHDFLNTKNLHGTVRISLGAFNKTDDIDVLADALKSL